MPAPAVCLPNYGGGSGGMQMPIFLDVVPVRRGGMPGSRSPGISLGLNFYYQAVAQHAW